MATRFQSNLYVRFSLKPVAAAVLIASTPAFAQTQTPTLAPVTITAQPDPATGVSGWQVPLSRAPMQASIVTNEQLRDRGLQALSELTRVDASVSDAYNSQGYWDYLSVRGFTLDNRFNYRRDGLPISAETSIPLDNKERIEVLKGTSGIQAGTSAPGGLANFVVKRPAGEPVRDVRLGWRQAGSVLGAVDLSQRLGEDGAAGVRVNAAAERLDPMLRNARGNRNMLATAGEARIASGTLIEAEFEISHRSQTNQAPFSLLGTAVPAPTDPRINLANQPWSQPTVFDGQTASLRATHDIAPGWRATLHAATQRLQTDDRLAFPFGCSAALNFSSFCTDGTFDLYDFRSENERRRTDALEAALHGDFNTGALRHSGSVGILRTRVKNRAQAQAYNPAGTGNIDGSAVISAAPAATTPSTERDERSTEFFVRDSIQINDALALWAGLRHTRIDRSSVLTDGSEATPSTGSFTTPWLAASYAFAAEQMVYASWGRGLENDAVPNRTSYTNQGQVFSSRSRQLEAGIKIGTPAVHWGLAWFDIQRPTTLDVGACDGSAASCTRVGDGQAHHQGIEANAAARLGAWSWQGSLMLLDASREDSPNPGSNGMRPTNVPARSIRLQARYRVPTVEGLELQANASAESNRVALPDNSVRIPGYGVMDLGARYAQKLQATTLTWRAGIDNLLNRRAWRESPFMFNHAYLYPLGPRTLRVSLEASL